MGKRILVADDSLTIQKAFSMVLAGQDYTLVFARSVEEALTAAKAGRPDLVYADAVMGAGNGYDLCAAIKTDPAFRGVPVHILDSNQNPYDEAKAHRVGADGHLLKPFDSQGLLDCVSAALTAPVVEPAPVRPAPVVSAPTRPAPAAPRPVEKGNTTEEIEPEDAGDDDSYGEFTIERSSAPSPAAAWGTRPATWPGSNTGARAATPTPPTAVPPNRPSLIPGVSPPAPVAPARPAPALPGVIPAPPPTGAGRATAVNRTMMGFPGVGAAQPPATPPAPAPAASTVTQPLPAKPIVPRPSSPVPAPVMPRPTPPPPTATLSGPPPAVPVVPRKTGPVAIPVPQFVAPAPVVASVSAAIDQKVAAIATRGKEYEAIAKLSREIIEQVVWEVVPELAEAIIKQEIDRLVAAKR
jgi:CheY-like chemotaxis protein